MFQKKLFLVSLVAISILIGCTESSRLSIISSLSTSRKTFPGAGQDNLPPSVPASEASVDIVSQVKIAQIAANNDPNYAITQDDVLALKNEGIITGDELTGWVK
jgi:hypothetical protein